MLVLSVKKGAFIELNLDGRAVRVHFAGRLWDAKGSKARIGIEAPSDVQVLRSELIEKKEQGEANE